MSTILVVDDDRDICTLVATKLALDGHRVVVEHDGEGGLAAFHDEAPDLVLLDWMMPRLTGVEVCLAIRGEPTGGEVAGSRTPVIMLTARSQEADVQRAFAAGADDYVVKPFSPAELASRVARLLGGRSS